MKADAITFKIEEDGTITMITDAVSPQVHLNAEEFLKMVQTGLGGATVTKANPVAHHHHGHGTHVHAGGKHSH